MRTIAFLLALFVAPAFGAVTITESTVITLLRGSTTVGTYASWEACRAQALQLARRARR